MKSEKNFTESLLYGIFGIVGVIFIIVAIMSGVSGSKKKAGYERVDGIISDIEHYGDSNYVYVDYRYKGQDYSNISLNTYVSTMHEGDDIELYLDDSDPFKPYYPGGTAILILVFGVMGTVFALVGIVPTTLKAINGKKDRALIEAGYSVWATVDEVAYNYHYSVNGRHPVNILASYTDDYSAKSYTFKSRNIWDESADFIDQGDQIRVYLDRNDFTRYYVDSESVTHNDNANLSTNW